MSQGLCAAPKEGTYSTAECDARQNFPCITHGIRDAKSTNKPNNSNLEHSDSYSYRVMSKQAGLV